MCVGMTCLASNKRTSEAGRAILTWSGSWQHHWKHNTCTACNEPFEAPFSSLAVLISYLRSCQSVFRLLTADVIRVLQNLVAMNSIQWFV